MLYRLALLMAVAAGLAVADGTPVRAQTAYIDPSDVFISASALTDPAGGAAGEPFPNQVVNPFSSRWLSRPGGPPSTTS